MFRDILQEGQEEVPAHVWEGVSAGLDRIARRKKRLVIFRWSAAGVAVAAALGVGVILSYDQVGADVQAPEEGMIAVVPQEESGKNVDIRQILTAETLETETATSRPDDRIVRTAAEAARLADMTAEEPAEEPVEEIPEQIQVIEGQENLEELTTEEPVMEERPVEDRHLGEGQAEGEGFPDIWDDDEAPARKKVRTSLELSGLAGTNNSQNSQGKGLMKRPSISYSQAATGVTENSTNSTFGIPLSFGAGVRFDFTRRWSLAAGVRYTLLTRKFYGTYTSVDEEGNIDWTESSDIRNSQHFVGIPINAFFNIVNRDYLRFYVYAGGAVEKCVADKYQVLASSIVHTEKVKGVQMSVDAGVGVEFLLGKHLGIYIDPSLRYYFNNGQPTSIRTVRPLMLGFEAGLRVRL
ncbi:MAG: porin family protein [Candidatus Cryptobacteroides sp.]